MTLYLLFLAAVIICYINSGRHAIADDDYLENIVKKNRTKKDFIFFAFVLVVLMGFRGKTVGIDTTAYFEMFQRNNSLGSFGINSTSYKDEVGFQLLMIFLNKIAAGFQVLTIIEALIYVIPVMAFIHRYSKNPYYSVFLFLAFDYYLFGMTAMRQTIAMGIVMIAVMKALEERMGSFVLLVLFASLFHITALVALPIYFLKKKSINNVNIFAAITISLIVYIFKNQIQNVVRSYARIDYGNMTTGGNGMYLFLVSIVIIDLIINRDKDETIDGAYGLVRYMLISTVIIYPVLQFNPSAFRLHFYYSIVMIVYIPNTLQLIQNENMRHLASIGYTLVSLYYMSSYTFNQLGAVPYKFFWQ